MFRGWAGSSPRPPQAFPSPSVRLPDISSAPPQRLRSSTLACARPRPDQWLNLGSTTSARRAQRHCSDRIDAVVLTPRLNRDYSSLDDGLLLISPSSKHERIRGPRDPCESSPSWSPFRPASAPCSHLVFKASPETPRRAAESRSHAWYVAHASSSCCSLRRASVVPPTGFPRRPNHARTRALPALYTCLLGKEAGSNRRLPAAQVPRGRTHPPRMIFNSPAFRNYRAACVWEASWPCLLSGNPSAQI